MAAAQHPSMSLQDIAAEVRFLANELERQHQKLDAQGELILELVEAVAALTFWHSQHPPDPAQDRGSAQAPRRQSDSEPKMRPHSMQLPVKTRQIQHSRRNSRLQQLPKRSEGRRERKEWDDSPPQRQAALPVLSRKGQLSLRRGATATSLT